MAILKLLPVTVLALLTGCTLTRDPTAFDEAEDRVTVHGILVAGESEARVLLAIAPARADPFQLTFLQPVRGAAVRLVAGRDTTLLPASDGAVANPCFGSESGSPGSIAHELAPGCHYGVLSRPIVEGGTYELLVDLPDGGIVRGRTVIPAAARIERPGEGATMSAAAGATTTVGWSGAGGLRTELAVRPEDARCTVYVQEGPGSEPGGFWSVDVTGQAEAAVRVFPQCPTTGTGPVPAQLVISVFDTAYTRFAARAFGGVYPGLEEARAGITGPAIGYFGGVAPVMQPVVVQ